LIKYIVALFITFFTLNASEIDIVEDFGTDDNRAKINVVESIDSAELQSDKAIVYQEPVKEQVEKVKPKEESIKKPKKKEVKKEKKVKKEPIKEQNSSKTAKKRVLKHKKSGKNLPQLAIIIDDVSKRSQINFLKSLPYHITPSIFPPTRMNMNSNNLAKNLKHYMVHLPIESHSKAMNKIYKMLFLKDSNDKIRKRVKEIRRLFPNAKYLNNHTGSVFCRNYKKSKVLYKALKKEGFVFLDSRTSKKTKFNQIARELGYKYYKSDIFIDNVQNVNYTIKQIRKGVALAKKQGYAVIIGHPHPTTFKALKRASKYFKDVKLVYIDELKF